MTSCINMFSVLLALCEGIHRSPLDPTLGGPLTRALMFSVMWLAPAILRTLPICKNMVLLPLKTFSPVFYVDGSLSVRWLPTKIVSALARLKLTGEVDFDLIFHTTPREWISKCWEWFYCFLFVLGLISRNTCWRASVQRTIHCLVQYVCRKWHIIVWHNYCRWRLGLSLTWDKEWN